MWTKIRNFLLYGGLDRKTYRAVFPSITEGNRKALIVYCAITAFAQLVMLVMTFIDPVIVENRNVYALAFIPLVMILFIALTGSRNTPGRVYLCMYLFTALLFAYGIILGTYTKRNFLSVTFPVILFAIPILITDVPARIIAVIALGIGTYLPLAAARQAPSIFAMNKANVLAFGCLSMLVGCYMNAIKIGCLALEHHNLELINIDQLTGLPNRRAYETRLQQLRDEGLRLNMKICSFDLNGLKRANDELGHHAGDELIRGTADTLREVLEPYGICCRVGGDEFAAILNEDSPSADALREQLKARCAAFKGQYITAISLAIGIITVESAGDIDSLTKQADHEMYADKERYYTETHIDRRRN